jgi:hypothetical protein
MVPRRLHRRMGWAVPGRIRAEERRGRGRRSG